MLKLNQNFSNYSAWHYRTQLLPKAFGAADAAAVLRNELKLARAAYFTECRDQSAWMYVVWVLRMLKIHSPEFDALLDEELQHLRDLDALENGSALWPRFFAAILQAFRDPKSSSADFAAEMAHLSTIDPQRRNFYAQLRNDRCFLFDA